VISDYSNLFNYGIIKEWWSKLSLIHRTSGEEYAVLYAEMEKVDLQEVNKVNGWNFNWKSNYNQENFTVYKLMLQGDSNIQGLICIEPEDGWIEIHLTESAPWNIGSGKQEFTSVGSHLFAIACQESFNLSFDGYAAFYSKSKLVQHYERTLGATLVNIRSRRMVIDTKNANILVRAYLERGRS
jgi:hypothetical protein